MAIYRKIYMRFWTSLREKKLKLQDKAIAAYLLSGDQSNRIGLFKLSIAKAAEDLEISCKQFEQSLNRVCDTLSWEYDIECRILYIPTWWKWNPVESPLTFKGFLKDLNELPHSKLISKFCNNTKYLKHTLSDTLSNSLPIGYEIDYKIPYAKPGTGTGTGTGELNTLAENEKIAFSSRNGEFQNITENLFSLWEKAYPAINLKSEINKASAWLLANPKNQKKNYHRFLTNWFARAQEKAPRINGPELKKNEKGFPDTGREAPDADWTDQYIEKHLKYEREVLNEKKSVS